MINLRLDVFPLVLLERSDINFVVEVTDIADDGLILHLLHVVVGDDVVVAGGSDENVAELAGVVHGDHTIAFHRRLQCANRVNFRDPYLCRQRAHGLCAAFTHVAVTRDDGDLASNHHIGGALDAINQRFAAAIQIVELGLGDGIVDVDRREFQFATFKHLIQTVYAGGGFFSHTKDGGKSCGVPGLIGRQLCFNGIEQTNLFFGRRIVQQRRIFFSTRAQMQQQGRIAAVVQNHVGQTTVGPFKDTMSVIPVVGQ